MTLNILISPICGKVIFVVFDILVGELIYKIIMNAGHSTRTANVCASTWLFNPLPVTISTRGSAESLMAFTVLQSLDFLLRGQTAASAVVYAIAVHLKIYPITYALAIYLYLSSHNVAMVSAF